MITALRTNNFKKLESFSAEFKEGTNLVFGENGEGKSTAFDAIRFALFGSKGVTGTVDSLTTWNKTGMWVELDINGHTIRRTASNCKITKEGEMVASGNSPCVKYIENLLACSVKDFDLLYMSKQNETAGLITFGAAELNRKVEEYAGVAVIDKVIKSLGSEINGCQIALQSFEFKPSDELKSQVTYATNESHSASEQVTRLSGLESDLRLEMNSTKDKLREDRQFNSEQDEIAQRNESTTNRINRLQATTDASKVTLDKANELLAESNQVDEAELSKLQQDLDRVKSTNTKLTRLRPEADIVVQIKEAEEKQAKESAYLTQLPELEDAVTKCQESVDNLKSSHSEKVREYRQADQEATNGICSGCNRPLEDHDPEAAEAKKSKLGKEVTNSKTLLTAAEQTLQSAKDELKRHNQTNPGTGWGDKLTTLEGELETNRIERKQLEGVLANLAVQDQLEEKINSLVSDQRMYSRNVRDQKSAQEEHDDNVERLEQLKSQGMNQPQPKRETTGLENKLSAKVTELNNVVKELGEYRQVVAVFEEKVRSLKNQIASAEANNTKMAELEEQQDTAKQLRKYLNDERVKFMEGVWRTILGTASNFINKSTDGWITAVGRNDKGDFTFTENGYEAVAKESASGAQKAFIGTAIKVGLAQAKMGSSSMILLDEPTADMRDDRASQLAAGLMMLSGQKIMITHRDSERMIAQNIIHVGD
ncbi:hypothetical protein SIPHO067v1_p0068 [Vibrio phage 51E28.1]|nr:hypothetical protein SIPHO068v1_p0031 [Vibrio phage 51E28.4]QZI92908.1 hypothetical protein SIPHO067v1_p0068 [Vibrio phage 51E28.1]